MRIISGEARGRHLRAPRGDATRPTADRVRQALFDVLGSPADLAVLDLFAGTGALGLEALSRGARRAVFVDEAEPAIRVVRQNVEALGYGDRARRPGKCRERLMLLAFRSSRSNSRIP